jgi:hypothetical protein
MHLVEQRADAICEIGQRPHGRIGSTYPHDARFLEKSECVELPGKWLETQLGDRIRHIESNFVGEVADEGKRQVQVIGARYAAMFVALPNVVRQRRQR